MKAKEFRGLTAGDLQKRVLELGEELFQTKLQNMQGRLENTSKIKELRRMISRAKTVLNENLKR